MIPQITSALSKGFTHKQIIDFILKKFPDQADKIKTAMTMGFSADQVLKYISGGKKALNAIDKNSVSDSEEINTSHSKTRSRDIEQRENINKRALQAGGVVAGAIGAPMAANAIPMAAKALKHALPTALGSLIPDETEEPQPQNIQSTTSQPPMNNPVQQPVDNSIPQPAPIPQPEVNSIKDSLSKYKGFTDQIESLKKAGNGIEEINAYFKKFNPSQLAKLEKELGKPAKEIISEYLSESVQPNNDLLQKSNELAGNQPEIEQKPIENEVIEPIKEPETPKIEKSSLVLSPNGVGEVKEIRGDKAIIEIDGKKHKVNVNELESSPLPQKDLSDLYDELIQGIENESGEDVSRMVQWAGYDPESNTLQFLPHSGKLYTYDKISKEDANLLTDVLSTRKTTGANFIGAWKKDSKSPIGAALHKLIVKLQKERGGKGNEYAASYDTLYSAYEPAIQAKKNKKKKN